MCLVCFINAEESRSKQSGSYSATTSTVSEDSSDDGSESDQHLSTSHAIHYFAIGSMTNVTALALRELTPISSQPATLQGYRMVFRGSGGMATAEKEGDYEPYEADAETYPFSCIHGVLHLLSGPHMKILDDFEGGYRRKACKVLLYDGKTEVSAYVYQMDRSPWRKAALSSLQSTTASKEVEVDAEAERAPKVKHELPTERYLDIIAQGCQSHGVDPRWVEFIRQHQCIPRKSASEFASFSASMTDAMVPIIPWEQVRACNGKNGSKLWIVINNKVLEFKGDVTSFFPFGYFIKHKIGGTDFTVKFAKGFFEPKYIHGGGHSGSAGGSSSSAGGGHFNFNFSRVTSSAQLGNEHRAWIEDQFAAPPPVLASSKWALVGVVDVSVPVSDPVALARNSTFGMRRTKLISGRNNNNNSNNNHNSNSKTHSNGNASAITPSSSMGDGIADMGNSSSSSSSSTGSATIGTSTMMLGASATLATSTVAATAAAEVLDLTADVNAGYNHFFISGTSSSGVWIVPDGLHPGQTLYVRKTALEDFAAPVLIHIRNQSLGAPNVRADTYVMPPSVYYLSWCWDGQCWYLEQIGRAEG